ncbi:FecCD family ABC transporter permease [Brachybacterium saurashtrense]|uniref:Iron-enterobactin ABC transporter permease n=1 Tax=Brachybacterium saurashtrense TaxID=556288 RepID=A0A345YJT3_9MICO|nr:iron chelate uptake ABC transporter family permease subunit [Brachybacterium saurashtrense]AXK44185.1 iron-enterobactin ABC transporter permease [Brachybacterium saurashtrense]RRR21457.1 iron-enterobactin ABC transporter permease [Brachybacterium saurashtrense]
MTSLRDRTPSDPAAREAPLLDVGYRRLVLPVGRGVLAARARSLAVAAACGLLLLVLGVAALGLGTYPLTPTAVVETLLGGGGALDRTVVLQWRLPRALAAVVLGGLLAIAGALFQTVTRNPLASPDILGLSNGAFTGMLLTVLLVSESWPLTTAGAVGGGLATAAVIWALARRDGVQGFRLIVIGIGVAAVLASANTWMLLEIELETAMFASAWGTGTLNGVTARPLLGAIVCAVPLLLLLAAVSPRLRQLDLGDDVATATGARPGRVRTLVLLCAVLLVSIATAVIGPVAFIALAAPQIARRLARTPHLSLLLSALVGASLLLASDLIAQHVLPVTLPVGVVTVSVGGLYLVLVLIQEIRRRA